MHYARGCSLSRHLTQWNQTRRSSQSGLATWQTWRVAGEMPNERWPPDWERGRLPRTLCSPCAEGDDDSDQIPPGLVGSCGGSE